MPGAARQRAWAAVLTAPARGAIAVIRVGAAGALDVADAVFRPARGGPLRDSPPGRLRLGRAGEGLGDEVVAVVLPGEPPEVELHTHGGPAAVELVLGALREQGAEILRTAPGGWGLPQPATDPGGPDATEFTHAGALAEGAVARSVTPLQSAAWADLARAPTLRTATILLDQAQGALDRALLESLDRLQDRPESVAAALRELLDRAAVGLRLVEGWRVALAGRPNVGKSRLLNALAGYERAIVDATPGTTRDVVTVRTALGGWPVELADTAGIRPAGDPIETQGVARARAEHAAADLVLLVLDRSEPLTERDRALVAALPDALRVANKCDLPAAWDAAGAGALAVSAQEGEGIDELAAAIAARLVPQALPDRCAVPFRSDQADALREALEALQRGDVDGAQGVLRGLLEGEACSR